MHSECVLVLLVNTRSEQGLHQVKSTGGYLVTSLMTKTQISAVSTMSNTHLHVTIRGQKKATTQSNLKSYNTFKTAIAIIPL